MVIQKISDILKAKRPVFSFEIFPPKTPKGVEELYRTVETLCELSPDYISVTYRAGGSSRDLTLELAGEIQRRFGITTMHHLTLVNQTVDELSDVIKRIRDAGIVNILALRGDPPPEMGRHFRRIDGGLAYSFELIDLIRDIGGDHFCVAVAGFPEGHVSCPTKNLDTMTLAMKVEHGAQFVVTQFFFDNAVYSEYLARTAKAGITVPIVPGLLPVTDYNKLLSFSETCGAYICETVHSTFRPVREDTVEMARRGVRFGAEQAADLIARGAPGIHFYCLNKVEPARTIWANAARVAPAAPVADKA